MVKTLYCSWAQMTWWGGEEVTITVKCVKVNPGGWKNAAGVVKDGDGCTKADWKDRCMLVEYPTWNIRISFTLCFN
jgi:hypothetical protein